MSVAEAATALNSPINSTLVAGLETLDFKDSVTFTKYVRCVLPLDGYIFWIKADILKPSSVLNTSALNVTALNVDQTILSQAPIIVAQGSVHYSTEHIQDGDETYDKNQVVFTSESDIDQFNVVASNVLWIGEYDGIRFAFKHRKPLYKFAGIYHYVGDAIYPALATQIIDDPRFFDNQSLVVSNSIPLWLALNQYMPIYPSNLAEQNIDPIYATVDISSQQSLQQDAYIDQNSNTWQLVQETVKFTIYGLRNQEAIAFQRYIIDNSLYGNYGIMNSPIIKDEKRIQAEMSVIAMKKSFEMVVNYYQQAVFNIAKTLIESVTIQLIQYP